MENNIDASYGLDGYIILILTLAFIAFSVYYCNKVARELKINQSVAVLAALFFCIPALLIYSHLSYKAKNKTR